MSVCKNGSNTRYLSDGFHENLEFIAQKLAQSQSSHSGSLAIGCMAELCFDNQQQCSL